MYKLYTDKAEDFKCNIGVEGASISNTSARLVLENKNMNILFEGVVNSDGSCVIPIKKLKNILPEGLQGTMKLEVIADDTFFSPWQDEFIIEVNKKVTVEVANDTRKKNISENTINVQVTNVKQRASQIQKEVIKKRPKKKSRTHSEIMSEVLHSKGITLENFSKHLNTTLPLVKTYVKKYNVKQSADDLLNEIIINLK